jgi:hypothetical protein
LNATLQLFTFDIIAATLMRSFLYWPYGCFAAYNVDESAARNFVADRGVLLVFFGERFSWILSRMLRHRMSNLKKFSPSVGNVAK